MPHLPKSHNLCLKNFPMDDQLITKMTLSLLLLIFPIDAKAQNLTNTAQQVVHPRDSISNFEPSLAVVIGLLSIIFSLTFVLLLYAKFCHGTSSPHRNINRQIQDGLPRSNSRPPPALGVDKTVIESLPFFRFSSLKGSRDGLECTVCLAKFEDVEILRMLPKCKHAFHIGCIDRWLENHCTCPLCRKEVGAEDLSSDLTFSDSLRFLWREESNLELYVQREENHHQKSSRFSIIGSSFRKSDHNKGNKQDDDELAIQLMGSDENNSINHHLHRLNHKIVVSDVVFKNRWSNVSSSDLIFLNSEMLNDVSSARFFFSSDSTDYYEQKSMEMARKLKEDDDDKMMKIKEEMERKRVFERKVMEIKKTTTDPTTSDDSKRKWKAMDNIAKDKRSMSEIIVHPRFEELGDRDIRDSSATARNNNVKEEMMRRVWLPIARKTVQWFVNRERRAPPVFQGSTQT